MSSEKEVKAGLDGFGQVLNSLGGDVIINTTGDSKSVGYLTIRIRTTNQTEPTTIELIRPSETKTQIGSIMPKNGDEQRFKFTTAPVGTYKVRFMHVGTTPIDILCWVYG